MPAVILEECDFFSAESGDRLQIFMVREDEDVAVVFGDVERSFGTKPIISKKLETLK